MSSDFFWVDQSPEHQELGLADQLSDFWSNTLNFKVDSAYGVHPNGWNSPNSDPMGDLMKAKQDLQAGLLYTLSDEPTFFTYDLTPYEDSQVTVPLDALGRPCLDESGGLARIPQPDLCPAHGLKRRGGRCKKCR